MLTVLDAVVHVQKDLEMPNVLDTDGDPYVLRYCTKCHHLLPVAYFPPRKAGENSRVLCTACLPVPACSSVQELWDKIPGEVEAGQDRDGAYRRSMAGEADGAPGESWRNPLMIVHEGSPQYKHKCKARKCNPVKMLLKKCIVAGCCNDRMVSWTLCSAHHKVCFCVLCHCSA